ncbi:hypothetical protein Skr01_24510 [Sphaerisporangium krabiense]|uniref:DUF4386 family protein n=1 Tax=Sphaerisporangium krabiense TaxID=763782 RepID=A0A7W8ZB01_9ACTN|nr:hypothetical protein [Sphaerisporangium krabiense]MBB5630677.1 hypothetical protein [Sphaerisporangium krabiense]GII62366.1 hypothetical protein Skr01_24510 [Sphaerisporangium krabiense]
MPTDHSFPGRWTSAASMIGGPLLMLAGTLMRAPFPFFFPEQLAAVQRAPGLVIGGYTAFLAGNVLMWPAVVTLARRIGRTHRLWAAWGGVFVVVGLFERTFHAGMNQTAFRLVLRRGLDSATAFVQDSYADAHLFSYLSFTIMFGWYILAVGAYRSRVLGLTGSIALAAMGLVPLGVLKGTDVFTIAGALGACVAFLPPGVRLLREGPAPSRRSILLSLLAALLVALLAYASTLG